MDRERLKEVHQTDLTESRVNDDFVDWLKTQGPTYLLIILVGITGFVGFSRWREHRAASQTEAWVALNEASLPRSKEDVAAEHAGVFAVPQLALDAGAMQLMLAVQTGTALDQGVAIETPETRDQKVALDAEERDHYLKRADDMFRRVVEGDAGMDGDDGSLAWTLHALQALNGRAAVAEARGDVDEAKRLYEAAAERAEAFYPKLAEQARSRAASVGAYQADVTLPASADQTPSVFEPPLSPAVLDSSLRDLLMKDDEDGDDG